MATVKKKTTKKRVRGKRTAGGSLYGTGGRPLKYKSPEEMQKIIDEYFNECYKQKHERVTVKKTSFDQETGEKIETIEHEWVPLHYPSGEPVMEYVQPVTITGLARRLDMDRIQLIDYEERTEFAYTIKEAKRRVQEYVEWTMMNGGCHPSAAIFNLKNNYGWKDKTESEVTNTHMHLHGVAKASYQEADKLQAQKPMYRELPPEDTET